MQKKQLEETYQKLTSRRKEVLQMVLAGDSDDIIARGLHIKPATVRKYLERLYEAFQVSKRVELVALFAKYKPELIGNTENAALLEELTLQTIKGLEIERKQDLGEAPDTINFYGRNQQLETLKKWILQDNCRVVTVLGMGGLGKTALSVKLIEILQHEFDYIIWRSLREAPKLEIILKDCIKFFSNHNEINIKGNIKEKITLLIDYLRNQRCLLVLDNLESILQDGERAGRYKEGYEEYSILIQRLGESLHQSCLLLTSRTKPEDIAIKSGENSPIRSLLLPGLEQQEALNILQDKGLVGSEKHIQKLIEIYSGNPLALKIISTFIKDLFCGKINEFLSQGLSPFAGIENLLDSQFITLSDLEKEIMYWLAISREPISLKELLDNFVENPMFSAIIESLENLKRRSLIESVDGKFTLQNVVMEYMIALLVRQVSEEINSGDFKIFNRYSLLQSKARDYVRDAQNLLIVKPVAKNITNIEAQLFQVLKRKDKSILKKGYAVGNIINLLRHFDYNLSGLDLSNLTIWQAYLVGANLRNVKFNNSDLDKSRFAEAFGSVLCLAYNPNRSIWAMGDTKNKIRLRNTNGTQLVTMSEHTNWVRSLAFTPDGNILVSASDDKTVMVWNTQTGQRLKTLTGHQQRVWTVAISPDGNTIASGSKDRTIRLWDIHTGVCRQILETHKGWVRAVVFSPDGNILASGSSDCSIILWNANTGVAIKTLQEHSQRVRCVAFSPDGKILASSSDDSNIILWDIQTGQPLKTLIAHKNWVRSIAFSPDGKTLASGSEDSQVILWDTATGQRLTALTEHKAKIWSLIFCDVDGRTLLTSSSDDKTVKFWNAVTGQCLRTLQGHTNCAWSVAFSPNDNILASSNEDRTITLWDITTGEIYQTLLAHNNRIRTISISPDGRILASGGDDETIKLWNIHTGKLLKTFTDHPDIVLTLAFSPDGRLLVSGGDGKVLRLWDIKTGQYRQTQEFHESWIWSVAFSPDGKILASGSEDRSIKLWDVSTAKCLATLAEHADFVRSVKFHPQGNILASGSEDKTVKLWDVNARKCIHTLKTNIGWVRSIAFSPDGKLLAVAGGSPYVEIWNIHQLNNIYLDKTLDAHEERIWSVKFSRDGKILASSSEDGTIVLSNVETGEKLHLLRTPRLYEGMDITGATNLTEAQINTLVTLGAINSSPPFSQDENLKPLLEKIFSLDVKN